MPRQAKLFPAEEKKQQELDKQQKETEAADDKHREEREQEHEKEKIKKLNRKPKNEFYRCECGLVLHWKVAYGRRSGCPQCHKPIPLSDLFE
jgi:rubrerythrin